MSVIFRLAYGRRVRTLQDDIVLANIKAGGCRLLFCRIFPRAECVLPQSLESEFFASFRH